MSAVVIAMAITLFVLDSRLLTDAAVLFTVVLLIPSVVVDLMVLFGPKVDSNSDPLSRYRSCPEPRRRR
jgi:uncharacterized membrane protein